VACFTPSAASSAGAERLALGIEDGAAETLEQPGDILADGAKADDADRLAREHEGLARQMSGGPMPLLQLGMAEADIAQRREHQSEREFGDRHGVAAGGAGDLDAELLRRGDVDIVDADAPFMEQLQLLRGAQHIGGNADLAGDGVVGLGDDLLHVLVAARRAVGQHETGRQQRAQLHGAVGRGHVEQNDGFGHGQGSGRRRVRW
jgi:hypothetical protein